MADSKDTSGAASSAPTPAPATASDPGISAQSKALADAAVLSEAQHTDEGDEGGHYIVNDIDVNSDGLPIKKNAHGKWEVVKDGQ